MRHDGDRDRLAELRDQGCFDAQDTRCGRTRRAVTRREEQHLIARIELRFADANSRFFAVQPKAPVVIRRRAFFKRKSCSLDRGDFVIAVLDVPFPVPIAGGAEFQCPGSAGARARAAVLFNQSGRGRDLCRGYERFVLRALAHRPERDRRGSAGPRSAGNQESSELQNSKRGTDHTRACDEHRWDTTTRYNHEPTPFHEGLWACGRRQVSWLPGPPPAPSRPPSADRWLRAACCIDGAPRWASPVTVAGPRRNLTGFP